MLLYRLFFRTADCSVFVCHTQRRYWERRGVFLAAKRSDLQRRGHGAFRDRWSAEERLALRCALGFSEADYVIGLSALLRPEKTTCSWWTRSRACAARASARGR